MKIKKGDTILVTTGKDKGKKGKVVQAFNDKNKIAVENVNLKKKSVRPKKSGEKGQIVEFPAPLHVSNVILVCPKCMTAAKVGYKVTDKNKKRFCKKCNKEI